MRNREDMSIDLISHTPGVDRTWSKLALGTHFEGRTFPLVQMTAQQRDSAPAEPRSAH